MCVPWGNEEERAEWYKRRCEDLGRELAAYEDTGLTPADIPALTARAEAAEAERDTYKAALKAALEALHINADFWWIRFA